ncbi:MAG: hypothetical protein ABIH37_05350 [archaeon]
MEGLEWNPELLTDLAVEGVANAMGFRFRKLEGFGRVFYRDEQYDLRFVEDDSAADERNKRLFLVRFSLDWNGNPGRFVEFADETIATRAIFKEDGLLARAREKEQFSSFHHRLKYLGVGIEEIKDSEHPDWTKRFDLTVKHSVGRALLRLDKRSFQETVAEYGFRPIFVGAHCCYAKL